MIYHLSQTLWDLLCRNYHSKSTVQSFERSQHFDKVGFPEKRDARGVKDNGESDMVTLAVVPGPRK